MIALSLEILIFLGFMGYLDLWVEKKSNSICYHACREAVAMGELLTTHIPTTMNLADLATKVIPGGIKRDSLLNMLMHDIAMVATCSAPKIQRVLRVSPRLS